MGQFGIGQPVPRTEDPRLLTGRGHYVSDVKLDNQAFGVTVRSPHAHAKILSIDTSAAEAAPGVLMVMTHDHLAEANLGHTHPHFPPRKRPKDGSDVYWASHPGLVPAGDTVKVIGDAVAFVVAETNAQAKDAAELVAVEYEPLPSVTETAKAMDPASPQLWEDYPDNVSNNFEMGDAAAVDAAMAKAAHVVKGRFVINRISTNSMETRGCVGEYDAREERYIMHCDTQSPHSCRAMLSEIFHVPETQIRILSRDIGGAFGLKAVHFPENRLTLLAAKLLGRPVKWVAERSEAILADDHARDQVWEAELALDADGTFLALRTHSVCNLGAYLTGGAGMVPTFMNLGGLAGVYTTPAIHTKVTAVYTNTSPTGPYRGAGRPEASYILERMIDIAASDTGLDRLELRRKNLIPSDAMPYKTGHSFVYDSGDFAKNQAMAEEMADVAGFEARRQESLARGKLRGLGLIHMIEMAGGPRPEQVEIRFNQTGTVSVYAGTKNQGQGHETMYKILLSDMLGLDSDDIRLIDDDTDQVAYGMGTIGSRSAITGGGAARVAADKIIEKGVKIAAHMLEAAEADIEFDSGMFKVAGTDKQASITDIAKTSFNPMALPPGMEVGLYERGTYTPAAASFPNGCHVCEVEVDPDTGKTQILRYVAVDDVGTVVNALTLEGQVHGGIVQGAGQALLENIDYDPETGQMRSGSFQDYAMPRADDMVSFEVGNNPVPSTGNLLGIKGAGEAGTTGALPCVMNAVINALGVRDVSMPLTAEKVWRVIQENGAAEAAE